jgi:hypothetical protein
VCVCVCVCGTCSATSGGQHRLGVFQITVLREIFGPERVEVGGEWGKLQNGVL